MDEQQTIIFIGSQGSGKGTQAQRLRELIEKEGGDTPTFLFSMGEEFRKFARGEGVTEGMVREYLERGELLPTFLPIWMWTRLFIQNAKGNEHIIFDGSPRTRFEAEILESAFSFFNRQSVTILRLNVSREEIVQRLLSRGREDDTEEVIETRIAWYEKNVGAALDFFAELPRYRFVDIDGEQSPDEVFNEIVTKLKSV